VSRSLIHQDLVPLTAGYVLVMDTIAAELRQQRRGRAAFPGRRVEPGTAAPGGRAWLLMAIVVAYYLGVARVSGNFPESAITGCSLLLGLSALLFQAASWLAERRGRRGRTDRR
jgi:Family of unknown function (DUF6256)